MFFVYASTGYQITPRPVSRWVAERIAADHSRFNPVIKEA